MPHEKDILPSVSGFQSCGSFMQQLLIPHFQIIVKKRIVYHAFKSRQQTDAFINSCLYFRHCCHFIIEEVQQLIHLVKAQRLFPLLQVTNKTKPYPRLQGQVFLRHIILLPQSLYCCRQIHTEPFIPLRVQK